MKRLYTILFILVVCAAGAVQMGPYDTGAARKDLSNVESTAAPTMTSITLTDHVDAANASFTGDIDVTGGFSVASATYVFAVCAADFNVTTGWTIASASTEVSDALGEYDPTTSTFTAAKAGNYIVEFKYHYDGVGTTSYAIGHTLRVDGINDDSYYTEAMRAPSWRYSHGFLQWHIRLTAGQTIQVAAVSNIGGTIAFKSSVGTMDGGIRIWRLH
jgi:hypothetical protein